MNRPDLDTRHVTYHDIPMINELLMEWCKDRKLDPDCSEARSTIEELHELFDIGVRDREALSEAIATT